MRSAGMRLVWIGALAACGACHRASGAATGRVSARALAAAEPAEQREVLVPVDISDDPVVNAIVELARADSQVDEQLAAVIADGPRLTGSTQSVAAEKWAVEQLRDWGLEAAREPWGELPVLFERGQATGDVIRPVRAQLEVGTPAWSPGTRGQDGVGAGGPMRGQALLHPRTALEFRELEPYLRDAWIMIPYDFERPDWRLQRQLERAFELAPIAGYVHGSGTPDDDRIWIGGDPDLDPAKLPSRVDVLMRGDEHHALLERMAAGDYVELEFAVGNVLLPGPVPAHNVIATFEGAERPREQVLVGAHLDSWDAGVGAVDNGAGVATTMEAARLIAAACARTGARPRRTLAFHLWTGGEQGSRGSRAWVAAHAEQLEQISAVLVHDHGTNYLSSLAVVPELHALLREVVAPVRALDPERYPFALEPVESLMPPRGDGRSFARAGVPVLDWGQSGRADDARYRHTQHDRAAAVIDAYQRRSALVVAIVAWQLAMLPEPLARDNTAALPPRSLGIVLEGLRVVEVEAGSIGEALGVERGDRVLEVDGAAIASEAELEAALQRGGPDKRIVLERGDPRERAGPEDGGEASAAKTIALEVDFRVDPHEAQRRARRSERRARFPPELIPWDDQANGGAENTRDE